MNGYVSSPAVNSSASQKQETLSAILGHTKGNLNDIHSELAMICQYLDGPTQEKQLTDVAPNPMGAIGVSYDLCSHSAKLVETVRYIRSRIAE